MGENRQKMGEKGRFFEIFRRQKGVWRRIRAKKAFLLLHETTIKKAIS
jgi:hypothetical protein